MNLPNLNSLGQNAFYKTNINGEVNLPNLNSIGSGAFRGTKVTSIVNLGNVTSVTGFEDCTSLTTINLPSSCNKLSYNAFKNCTNLILPNTLFTTIS